MRRINFKFLLSLKFIRAGFVLKKELKNFESDTSQRRVHPRRQAKELGMQE
jgi:hypothetical protein